MKDAEFFEQAIPGPASVVLGIQLKAFSLGHVFLLNRIESPFLSRAPVTLPDLVSAVFICSQNWRENIETIRTGTVERGWLCFRWRESAEKFTRRWHRRVGAFDILEAATAFQTYVNNASSVPYYSFEPTKARHVQCPAAQLVYTRLKGDYHLSEEEVYDRPWGRCIGDFLTAKSLEGSLHFEDRDEIREAQRLADEFERSINGGS